MEDLRPKFGARVRGLRKALELSQEELAERAEMHWTFISGVERGVRNPGLNAIGRIASALGVKPEVLFRDDASQSRRPRRKKS